MKYALAGRIVPMGGRKSEIEDGVVRNVEQTLDSELPCAQAPIADLEADNTDAFLARLNKETCLLLHLSEGTDDAARKHFAAARCHAAPSPDRSLLRAAPERSRAIGVSAEQDATLRWT
jgi:hypothetical protein